MYKQKNNFCNVSLGLCMYMCINYKYISHIHLYYLKKEKMIKNRKMLKRISKYTKKNT